MNDSTYALDFLYTCGLHIPAQMVAIFLAFRYCLRDTFIEYVHRGIVKTLRYAYKPELINRIMKLLKEDGRDSILSKNKKVMTEFYVYLGISGGLCLLLLAISAASIHVNAISALFDAKFMFGLLLTFIYVGLVVLIIYCVIKYIMDRAILVSEMDQQLIIFEEVAKVMKERIETQDNE